MVHRCVSKSTRAFKPELVRRKSAESGAVLRQLNRDIQYSLKIK